MADFVFIKITLITLLNIQLNGKDQHYIDMSSLIVV
jgi:hypothetical protein